MRRAQQRRKCQEGARAYSLGSRATEVVLPEACGSTRTHCSWRESRLSAGVAEVHLLMRCWSALAAYDEFSVRHGQPQPGRARCRPSQSGDTRRRESYSGHRPPPPLTRSPHNRGVASTTAGRDEGMDAFRSVLGMQPAFKKAGSRALLQMKGWATPAEPGAYRQALASHADHPG